MVDTTPLPPDPEAGPTPPAAADLPSPDALKDQARRLRQELDKSGTKISHARALELVAHQLGYRDWNTLSAASTAAAAQDVRRHNQKQLQLGERVAGTYLGQAFSGEVLAVQRLGSGHVRVTLHFDSPVDVVRFDSFSAFRQRVSCTLDEELTAPARTSDGWPHMRIDRRLPS
ncbi:glyoxalase superfamily protein [Pyruvatibacter mobilis]|uniref:glyoxalase superfamily protein n=1 Tax=Pyruvatibacter mobilis TaxID=1712261 RepID=UPI003BAD552C